MKHLDFIGSVCIPILHRHFVLIRIWRPYIESYSLEFPRGLAKIGEDPETTAGRELREKTGYTTKHKPQIIGSIHQDSEHRCFFKPIAVCVAKCNDNPTPSLIRLAPAEKIEEVVVIPQRTLETHIREGSIKCGITLAAYALFLATQETVG